MSYVWAHGKDLDDINDAIKTKNGSQTDYTIDQMAAAIDNIPKYTLKSLLEKTINILDFNDIEIIYDYAFNGCTSLTTVNLPVCTTIYDYAFMSCTSLTTVNLPSCTSIGEGAFSGCTSLIGVILSGPTVCTLETNFVFDNTPIASGTGYIYVSDNLVDTYKAATNWSAYASQIVAISE